MQLSDFSFHVPAHLIAQYPLPDRSASRLMVLDGGDGRLSHRQFTDLPDLLEPGDLLVMNDTRVIPARLFGQKASGGKIEVMLERLLGDQQALVRIRASKAPKTGSELRMHGVSAKVVKRQGEFFVLGFAASVDLLALLREHGHIPLPPYIQRLAVADDAERYQTIYAQQPGAVAAPTAGLHFDQAIFDRLLARGIKTATVTLHVGAGTFQPVRAQDPALHEMHFERVEVSAATVAQILQTRKQGGRIVAVGTTTVRSLEAAAAHGELAAFSGETNLFITPGCAFSVVDAMITNFHLPESTLLMLVSAFSGHPQIMHAYAVAIEQGYRFYSYGDAMLLWPDRASWRHEGKAHD